MTKSKFATIRVDEEERGIIDKKMTETGLGEAAALRLIIREWAQYKSQMVTIPKAGIIDGDKIQLRKYWNSPDGIEQSR